MLRWLFGFLLVLPTRGQDTRKVVEPVFPPACAVLHSRLSMVDETQPDTRRIQQALDTCAPGGAVELSPDGSRAAFLSGPLDLRAGVTLRIGAGVTLYASRNPRDFDVSAGRCGTVDQIGRDCRALINGDHVAGAAVMGEGTIDGRGGDKLLNQDFTWWGLAEKARAGGNQNCPRLIVLSYSNDFTLYRITLKNRPISTCTTAMATALPPGGVVINTPKNARNTDGIDPAASTNATITNCFIHTGDDNVAIKARGRTSHITVAHNHFYAGHGMSIGSETSGGAEAIRVTDLSIDGADNGLRIKSNDTRGGLVRDVEYSDICIRNTRNPILMDTHYSASRSPETNLIPSFTGIVLRNVRILTGGKITLDGYDERHRMGLTFDNVYLDAPGSTPISVSYADVTCSATTHPFACSDKFVPLP